MFYTLIPYFANLNSYSGRRLKRQAKEVGLKNQEREVSKKNLVTRYRSRIRIKKSEYRIQKAMNEDQNSIRKAYSGNERCEKKIKIDSKEGNTE